LFTPKNTGSNEINFYPLVINRSAIQLYLRFIVVMVDGLSELEALSLAFSLFLIIFEKTVIILSP